MKLLSDAATVHHAGLTISVKHYADGRFGFDYRSSGVRIKSRKKTLPMAIEAAHVICRASGFASFQSEGFRVKSAIVELSEGAKSVRAKTKQLMHCVRQRARARGQVCGIVLKELRAIGDAQNWSCAVTGIPFDWTRQSDWTKAPFAPSVDRIDNKRGYEADNIRLVATCVNFAMNEWGAETFARMCRAFAGFTATKGDLE